MQKLSICALISAVLLLLWQPQAMAEEALLSEDEHLFHGGMTEVSIGLELFRWQEYDNSDIRLLTEQGPRVRLSLSLNYDGRLSGCVSY